MTPNAREIRCEQCGGVAVVEVIPDGLYDAPSTFTLTIACRTCPKQHVMLTAREMHERTGFPMIGWRAIMGTCQLLFVVLSLC